MWGADLTTTLTSEGQVAVFVAVDHYSAECVGIHAARRATRFEALEPIRRGCGAVGVPRLKLRAAGTPGKPRLSKATLPLSRLLRASLQHLEQELGAEHLEAGSYAA